MSEVCLGTFYKLLKIIPNTKLKFHVLSLKSKLKLSTQTEIFGKVYFFKDF